MRRNGVLTIGLLVLAFTAVGFYGNFVQWADVETVTAKVLNAERNAVLKGQGHTTLEIGYPVGKDILHATVSVAGSDPGNETTDAGISVFYMRKSPLRVIPVSVLKDKQRTIYVTLVIGAILTVAGLVVGRRKKSESLDKMKEILKAMDQPPERPLAADEEMRTFKDATTGKYYSKIVKKVNPDRPQPRAAAPYPAQQNVEFVTAERIVVPHGGRSFELSIHYHRETAEGDDIIRSSAGGEMYLVHPMMLFQQLKDGPNRFVSNLRVEEVADLAKRPCLVVECMEESRKYHVITVDGLSVSVPGKYLGLTFRLIVRGDELLLVTQGLRDENADELPLVVTTLAKMFVSATSARYDADDEMWYLHEDNPVGESRTVNVVRNGQPPSPGDVATRAAPEK